MSTATTALVGLACVAGLGASACTTYQYAKDVKMVSFDDNVTQGHSVGPVRGEDCQRFVLGYPIDENPTLDQAFADARKESQIRYMNNVSTDYAGFDAVVYGKRCLVVKGTGYR